MGKKTIAWKPKGMNRDLSVSAFTAEFTFENLNLRLSTNENNTLMSWVNEKGTYKMLMWTLSESITQSLVIQGTPIGTAVINHWLVIFTKSSGQNPDYIYRFKYCGFHDGEIEALTGPLMRGEILYNGNLNFDVNHPLETLVSYEAEHIQKVYWTDNKNQPRVINIATPADERNWDDTSFDFVPTVSFDDTFIVENYFSGGIFHSGVIQYCFTYISKYGQQSNVVKVSPIYYLAYNERGGSPDDIVNNSFVITIYDADRSFDYVRLYSIQRSYKDAQVYVKLLEDIPIPAEGEDNLITYTDNGTTGSVVDPYELLFVGGKEISVLTMTDKSETLFMGNITQKNTLVSDIQDYFNNLRADHNTVEIEFKNDGEIKQIQFDSVYGHYAHTNQLKFNNSEITTFKGGDTYRFGFQFQKYTGEWLEPIFIDDFKNEFYPKVDIPYNTANLVYAEGTIDYGALKEYFDEHSEDYPNVDFSAYKKIRPVVVYPSVLDRNVLCQGVLNPTVFNVEDRKDNSPFAQASWYFRPYMRSDGAGGWATGIQITYTPGGSPSSTSDLPLDNVYVLIACIKPDKVNDVLAAGYLHAKKGASRKDYKYNFDKGAICLNKNMHKYAFVSSHPFAQHNTVSTGDAYCNYIDVEISTQADAPYTSESTTFSLYRDMGVSEKHLMFYQAPDDTVAHESFVFEFTDANGVYIVTFPSYTAPQGVFGNFGDKLAYKHYDSLPTDISISDSHKVYSLSKEVEIQGSIKSYETPFSEAVQINSKDVKSNTQFFVDQSIVTLNSPDLEWDTNVQTYNMEGLKLRIVGMIPITANCSSHSIRTASSMLETNHNETKESGVTYDFGAGELNTNVYFKNISRSAGRRLVAAYLWEDVAIYSLTNRKKKDDDDAETDDNIRTSEHPQTFLIYPWHRAGSLNNDWRSNEYASSLLKTKKESNSLYSVGTEYFHTGYESNAYTPISTLNSFNNLSVEMNLTENADIRSIRIKSQESGSSEVNYYPNVDKLLYNSEGYQPVIKGLEPASTATESAIVALVRKLFKSFKGDGNTTDFEDVITPVPMKYKSTSHYVISLNSNNSVIPILPYEKYGSGSGDKIGDVNFSTPNAPFWDENTISFSQGYVNTSNLYSKNFNFLWLGELYKDVTEESRFGGKSREALINNKWQVGGEAVDIPSTVESDTTITLKWTYGDTYYQRYDCLKTYAFTPDDYNQIVEILSFMCETHVNIDGRYDENRGYIKNHNMTPDVFNLLNPVYTQQDNYFPIIKTDNKDDTLRYPNQVCYSKTKTLGDDVDLWTNVTLASTLALDGDKGEITSLNRLNDRVIAFQDTGISQILFDEHVQIPTSQGVALELANSGKVSGKRYFSDTIGCSNKWSIVQSPSGLYFMDSHHKDIYLFNEQLVNLSQKNGFNTWSKSNIDMSVWKSVWSNDNPNSFVGYYDKKNQEVLFINSHTALAYSERIGEFTSFYNYEDTPYFCNLDDIGIWLGKSKAEDASDKYFLWKHHGGLYCNFFDVNRPYSMTLIGNPEAHLTKIFTNLEFRACVDSDVEESADSGKLLTPLFPFDSLEAWNEYQHGINNLSEKNYSYMKHHSLDNIGSLKRKLRLWACDIPRDNYPFAEGQNKEDNKEKNIYRLKVHPMDRIKNPWIYLKLQKNALEEGSLSRAEIHDILMTYYL